MVALRKSFAMSDETKYEWLSLGAAAKRDEVPVSRTTLLNMIKRGDVPDYGFRRIDMGSWFIYQMRSDVLVDLPYLDHGVNRRYSEQFNDDTDLPTD